MQTTSRKAFTMIELIFVIVVIAILSAIAIPKFAATRDDAIIAKARATVASVRSALATERQKRILRGVFDDINKSAIGVSSSPFQELLEYDVKTCSTTGCGGWSITNTSNTNPEYTFHGPSGTCAFDLNNSRFDKGTCTISGMADL